jgi:hypothetical protein
LGEVSLFTFKPKMTSQVTIKMDSGNGKWKGQDAPFGVACNIRK